jgi:hypothetical protein
MAREQDARQATEELDALAAEGKDRVKFYIRIDDGELIELKNDEPITQLNRFEQVHGLLKALRYMLEVPEFGSVLDRCARVMRRYKQYTNFK